MAASQTTVETEAAASGLLIFDGDCGFCTSAARKFGDLALESVAVRPWQTLDLEALGLTESDVSSAVYFVQGERTTRGADACVDALSVCRAPWPAIGKVLALPPFIWIARALYPVVAKYRYRLPGATPACRVG